MAIELDPDNAFARERLTEAVREPPQVVPAILPERLQGAGEIHLEPKNDLATFHFSGDIRGLFSELGMAYGVKAQFDDSVQNRQVRFNVDDVDFFTAIKLAGEVSKTMWVALNAHELLIAADNQENHRQLDHMSLQTFVAPAHSTPQEMTELVNTLRTMFDLRFITAGQTAGQLDVRAPAPILAACAKLLAQLDNQRPQVMIELRVFQIDHQLTRNIGINIPNSFNLYNIPAAALAGLGGQNIQDLINQLIASGGINQAGSSALSGLLAQLGSQQNSIFSQPLTTFGGGLTFMGLSLGQLSPTLSLNESWVHSLEDMTMRAGQGTDATFHLGERYPILNASYAPIYNSPQISQVLGNQTYVPPFPSVSYEDLGLELKAKPVAHGNGEISMTLQMQLRSLTGQSANGVPVIANSEYHGSIRLRDGEPAVVAGEITTNDERSMEGLPIASEIPGLDLAFADNTRMKEDDELLIMITPHVVASHGFATDEIWVGEK